MWDRRGLLGQERAHPEMYLDTNTWESEVVWFEPWCWFWECIHESSSEWLANKQCLWGMHPVTSLSEFKELLNGLSRVVYIYCRCLHQTHVYRVITSVNTPPQTSHHLSPLFQIPLDRIIQFCIFPRSFHVSMLTRWLQHREPSQRWEYSCD